MRSPRSRPCQRRRAVQGVIAIEADTTVHHPLYPELGAGRVIRISRSVPPAAQVEWSTGQTSTHAVSILMTEFDRQARAMGHILGTRLDAQLTNAEYLDSRGRGNPEATALLRRAVQLRDAEAAR